MAPLISRGFQAQARALLYKAYRKHTKPSEVMLRCARLLIPITMLVLTYLAQTYGAPHRKTLVKQIYPWFVDDRQVAIALVGTFFRAGIDYAFVLSLLTVSLLSIPSSTTERVNDRVSGLRFLLRSNGLSNTAYWISSFIDTFLVTFFDVLVLCVGAYFLKVRVVAKTSVFLVFSLMVLFVATVVSLAFVLGQILSSKRMARMVPMLLFLVLFWAAPILCFVDEAEIFNAKRGSSDGLDDVMQYLDGDSSSPTGMNAFLQRRSKYTMYFLSSLPPFTAYSLCHNMAMACISGQCLTLSHVRPPVGYAEYTNGHDAFMLILVTCAQVLGCWLLVLLFDISSRSHNFADEEQPETSKSGRRLLAQIDGLKKQYGSFEALRGVSFTVEEGACVGLLGPNGAGKSTLCKILTRQLPSTSGRVTTYSRKSTTFQTGGTAAVNDFMGVCPQDTVLFDNLTVLDHLHFFAKLRGMVGGAAEDSLCEKFIDMVDLRDKVHDTPRVLSGGTRRKLSVCCSLIASPGCIVLDEPTTGIDALSRRQIWDFVKSCLQTGCGSLVTTHMLDEAEALCTKLVIIKKGQIVESGTTQELKEKYGTGYALHVDFEPVNKKTVMAYLETVLPEAHRKPVDSSYWTDGISSGQERQGRRGSVRRARRERIVKRHHPLGH